MRFSKWELIVGVEGEAAARDPKFEEVSVVAGRLALLEEQDVGKGQPEGHRPKWETYPPDDMEEAEQDQDHPYGKSG
jgi:hypothetical protein